jgi:peptide/histidine transporter 3/4
LIEASRWLDKAAILCEASERPAAWSVCTVTQVEEVKILVRMLPIVGSTIIMNTCMAQLQTFSVIQGSITNRHLGSIEIPAPSIPVIPLVFMSILLPMYEFVFVPLIRKITHHPSGITQLQRVGVGLVLSAISMAVAGFVEVKRKNQAIRDPTKPISLFWLSFQYGIFGTADMFTLVGLLEFFYKEAPAAMRSLSTSLTWLSLSLGYFLSTVLVDVINAVTERNGEQGWIYGLDLNKNHLNLFYWFLPAAGSSNTFFC